MSQQKLSNLNANTPPNQKWHKVIQNLKAFTLAATCLIKSFERGIEISKKQSSGVIDKEFSCECAKLSENLGNFSVRKNVSVSKSSFQPTNVKKNIRSEELLCLCSLDTEELEKPDEKIEKLVKLKGDIAATQQNLTVISEQIRQIERLYQDYDSYNTKDGQVNVAALYKEIMKPRTVPFVRTNNSFTPKQICPEPPQNTPLSKGKMAFNKQPCPPNHVQQKVSVLSAVPFSPFC